MCIKHELDCVSVCTLKESAAGAPYDRSVSKASGSIASSAGLSLLMRCYEPQQLILFPFEVRECQFQLGCELICSTQWINLNKIHSN